MLCALPYVGTLVGGSAGLALKVIGKGFTLGFAAESTFESISRAYDAYKDGTLSWMECSGMSESMCWALDLRQEDLKEPLGMLWRGEQNRDLLIRRFLGGEINLI